MAAEIDDVPVLPEHRHRASMRPRRMAAEIGFDTNTASPLRLMLQ